MVFLCGLWCVGGFHVEEVGGEVLALVVWGEDAALFPCGDGGFVVAECGEGLSWEEGVGVLFEGFPELLAGGGLGLWVGLEVAGDFAEAGPELVDFGCPFVEVPVGVEPGDGVVVSA